jgi:hypothetical protein
MSWSYPSTGLATPLDGLLRVLRDIMHAEAPDGQEAMDHLQCLLGYGLTGHTSSQVGRLTYYGFIQNNLSRESDRSPNISESMLPAISPSHDPLLKRSHLALHSRWPRGVWIICNAFGKTGWERDTYYGFIQKQFY